MFLQVNEPYSSGPGGEGQYTHKVYHVGRYVYARAPDVDIRSVVDVALSDFFVDL
jgi:hypothetical protein